MWETENEWPIICSAIWPFGKSVDSMHFFISHMWQKWRDRDRDRGRETHRLGLFTKPLDESSFRFYRTECIINVLNTDCMLYQTFGFHLCPSHCRLLNLQRVNNKQAVSRKMEADDFIPGYWKAKLRKFVFFQNFLYFFKIFCHFSIFLLFYFSSLIWSKIRN